MLVKYHIADVSGAKFSVITFWNDEELPLGVMKVYQKSTNCVEKEVKQQIQIGRCEGRLCRYS